MKRETEKERKQREKRDKEYFRQMDFQRFMWWEFGDKKPKRVWA